MHVIIQDKCVINLDGNDIKRNWKLFILICKIKINNYIGLYLKT